MQVSNMHVSSVLGHQQQSTFKPACHTDIVWATGYMAVKILVKVFPQVELLLWKEILEEKNLIYIHFKIVIYFFPNEFFSV